MVDQKKKVKKVEKKETTKVKEKTREVPFKNYLILTFVCLLTLGIIVFASLMYSREERKRLETPVISGVLAEIKKEDIDNYIVENESFFLYIGTASDYNCREVEEDLIKYFDRRDIKNDTIYLNLTNETELNKLYDDFNSKYVINDYSKLKAYPAFIIFKDGKVLDLVQKGENQRLNIGDIDRVLDEYGY